MNCQNCGYSNIAGARFCGNCGSKLPTEGLTPPATFNPVQSSTNSTSFTAVIVGLVALIGGVLVVIGWLLPWFGIGTSYSNSGGLFSLLYGSAGGGSGFQLALAALLGALASFGIGVAIGNTGAAAGVLIGIIALANFCLLIAIPILGINNMRSGSSAYSLRNSNKGLDKSIINGLQHEIRSRSISGLILLVVIYILTSLIPFLSNFLGGGFFLTAIAFGISFLGAFLTS